MVLMVFNKKACREYSFENRENGLTTLVLNKHELALAHSVALQIEVIDGRLLVACDSSCEFIKDGIARRTLDICDNEAITLATSSGEKLSLIFLTCQNSIPVCSKLVLDTTKIITAGASESNSIVYQYRGIVSRVHACLLFSGNAWYLRAEGKNGTYLNGRLVRRDTRLKFGDTVYIFGLKLIYFGQILAVSSFFAPFTVGSDVTIYNTALNRLGVSGNGRPKPFFNRSPRNLPTIYNGSVEIDAPPAQKEQSEKNIMSLIGRPLTMSLPMLLGCGMMTLGAGRSGSFMSLGVVTAVSSAVFGAGWAIANVRNQEKDAAAKERKRFNAYGNYLIGISKSLAEKYNQNFQALNSMYPSAKKCVGYSRSSVGLWNRNPMHEDFLFVRLGLGSIPFQAEIKAPKAGFSVVNDKMQDCPAEIQSEYKTLHDVPVGIDLIKNQLVGIVGKKGTNANIGLAQTIITQIVANNCYTDVKLVLLDVRKNEEDSTWDFMRRLPHCWSEGKKNRFYSTCKADVEDISYELLKILRMRANSDNDSVKKPHYVIIMTDPFLLDKSMLLNYIVNPQPSYGITTLILSNSFVALPNSCGLLLESDGVSCSINEMMDVNRQNIRIVQDTVSTDELNKFAHRMADITVEEKESDQGIPSGVDFLSMYSVKSVGGLEIEKRWREGNTSDSIGVPIGVKSGGRLCYLDIHEKYHGPHGLVAGTTGSGKSELLQSYILSLSVNFSPEDISFFIIDYKGGGMANLFSKLPHMVGQISNLSGTQIRRAMISIKSESIRRQRIFSEYGVNNVNQYRQMYTEGGTDIAIPHLVIIIDEFAELKKAEPDFMRELISIAQVGRSLGIHLILATQKPSGTVDDNIRSNSKFRLCLRVQDRQDSVDMLHRPDAAFITQAGGCIMQVGNDEIFEPFQSAWSAAIYDEAQTGGDDSASILTHTGKAAIAGNRMKVKRFEQKKFKWYCHIVSAIRRAAVNGNIGSLSGQSLPLLCEKAALQMSRDNVEWKGSPVGLEPFIRLWPQEDCSGLDDESIAKIIAERAEELSVRLPAFEEKTQLEAVISEIAAIAKKNGLKPTYQLWLPILPQLIALDSIDGWKEKSFEGGAWNRRENDWTMEAIVGMLDDPHNQAQIPLYMDFARGGNHAVLGTVACGKSTLLQTVVYGLVNSYTPEQLNVYIIDYSSRMLGVFEGLPHVGGVVFEGEGDKTEKLFFLLSEIIRQRKNILKGGTYREYIRLHPNSMPSVLLVVDNYAGFKEKTDGKYEAQMMQLSREGIGYGVFLLISAAGFGLTEITSKMGDNLRTVFTLELSDKFKYVDALHTTGINILPESGVKGRGLVRYGDRCLEYQTALVNDLPDDYSRGQAVMQLFEKMKARWNGASAMRIPEIPGDPTFSLFKTEPGFFAASKDASRLALGYDADTASVYSLNLSKLYCFLALGQSNSGKTNLLSVLVNSSLMKPDADVVLYSKTDAFLNVKSSRVEKISTDEELFAYLKKVTPEFVARNKKKHEWLNEGADNTELFEKMQSFRPVFIFIDNLLDFMKAVYTPSDPSISMKGFVENIFDRGMMHNIYIFGSASLSDTAKLGSYKAFGLFTASKTGALTGAAVSSQRLLDFGRIPYSESTKAPPAGTAIIADTEGASALKKVVLPAARR